MSFGVLAVVVIAGLIGPLLSSAHRLGPPIVVGEIAAGVAIGASGLRWIDPADAGLRALASIGFALLMFVVGTHLPVRDRALRGALAHGAAILITVGATASGAAVLLTRIVGLHRPAIIAVVLATSSAAVALPVLQAKNADNQVSGARSTLIAIAWIALADIATVLAIPIVMATGGLARIVTGSVAVIAAGGFVWFLGRQSLRSPWVDLVRSKSRASGWALDLRVALLVLFSLAWLATRFGSSVLLAGFAAGTVVALLGEPRRVAQQLIGLGEGFLIPLFFVHLGAQLSLRQLVTSSDNLRLAGALAGTAIAIHVIAAVVWRLPMAYGLIASAQLGVPSAIVSIGLSSGQLRSGQAAAIMAGVVVSLAACAAGSALLGRPLSLTDASGPLGGDGE